MSDDFELPNGWVVKPLGDAAHLVKDKVDPTTVPEARYIGLEHVESHTMRLLGCGRGSDVKSAKTMFAAGDVLYGKLRPYLNKVARPTFDGISSTDFLVFTESDQLDAGYLAQFLNQLSVANYAHHVSAGVELPRVGWKSLSALPIVFPTSKVEQRAVVAEITRARTHGTSAGNHLRAARRAIERFRQAVLAAACSGRLTTDWRDSRGLGEWEIERADDACSKVQSGSTPKVWHTDDGGIPFLKVYNIVDQKVNFDYRPQFISPELFQTKYRRTEALPGDVLMNIVGPPLGKVAIVTDQYPTWSINQAITLFRPSERVSTDWLYIFLCSGISVAEVMNDTKGTVGQVNISLTQCRSFEIPIPTMHEQLEIARRVDALFTLAQGVASRVNAATRRVDRSSQAVLAKAFRGELVASSESG